MIKQDDDEGRWCKIGSIVKEKSIDQMKKDEQKKRDSFFFANLNKIENESKLFTFYVHKFAKGFSFCALINFYSLLK